MSTLTGSVFADSKTMAARYAHWLLLAIAVALVAVRYAPAAFLSFFSSDAIVHGIFFRDVYEHGGVAKQFVWGSKSDLFPDLALLFVVYRLTGDSLFAAQLLTALTFLGYVAGMIGLYRASGGRHTESVVPLMALICVVAFTNMAAFGRLKIDDMFMPGIHSGTKVMALVSLAIVQRHAFAPAIGGAFWLMAVLCTLTAASDPLFAVVFTAPAVLMMLVWRVAERDRAQAPLSWIANLLTTTLFGIWIGPRVAPFSVSSFETHVSVDNIRAGIDGLVASLPPSRGGPFVVLLAVATLTVPAAAVLIRRPPRALSRLPGHDALLRLLLSAAMLSIVNLGVLLLLGHFRFGTAVIRYFDFALLFPWIVAATFLVELTTWSAAVVRASYVAAAAIVLAATIRLPAPNTYIQEAELLIPFLRNVMANEQVDAGLTDYWYANSLTFLSDDNIQLRSIRPTGSVLHWVSNRDWYARKPDGAPVAFRLILVTAGLDAAELRRRYGRPDKVVPAPTSKEVWIYGPSRRIVYVPHMEDLATAGAASVDQRSFRFAATSLPSNTGRADGDGIVATPQDAAGYVTYGPYIPLPSGRYRLTISYLYRTKPADGQEALYDAVLWTPAGAHVVDAAPFAVGNGLQELHRELTVDNPERGTFEARTYYRGSGVIEIRSISLTTVDQR